MELPNYRLPSPRSTGMLVWEKPKDFMQRAFTVIFIASIVIWFLQTFDAKLNPVANSRDSMLAAIGQFVSPIFAPLGFGDWRASTALLTGFTAKEAVVSTFAVLTGASGAALPQVLSGLFSPMGAIAFLVFVLLYSPCVAAISAVRREMNSHMSAISVVLYQTGLAWLTSFVVYQIGSLIIR
jgi:ferrous iron transport protein B